MIDAVARYPFLASGMVLVSAVDLVVVSRVSPHAHSPAQVRGPCRPARFLPRGDGFMQARERAQGVAFPLELSLLGLVLECLCFGIGIIARLVVVVCDALGEAAFSPGRCCAAWFGCILCVYWDSIPRAC